MPAENPWIRKLRAVPDASLTLFCIAHAGGGAWSFRGWDEGLPPQVELIGIQLPGREDRLIEPPLSNVEDIVAQLVQVLQPAPTAPYAFFGHSMGALIAFELMRELRRRGEPGPRMLFASAFRAPQLPRRHPDLHELSDAEFVTSVNARYAAVPDAVAANAELMELILPGLRADISVCDTYSYASDAPLDCPIVVFGGEKDDQVSREELGEWEHQAAAGFELVMFPGGHFYHQTARDEMLAVLADRLTRGNP
jgi:surfactin synthase thioesterase subunit